MTGRQWLGLALLGVGIALIAVALRGVLGSDNPPVAGASPSVSAPAPSETASPTPEPTPTPVPTPEPLGEADVRAFVPVLVAAVQTGDVDTLVSNLHPATIERYGEAGCRAQIATFTNPAFNIEILEVQAQAPWDYVTEDPPLTTNVPDAWAVVGTLTVGAGVPPQSQTFHFAPFDGSVRWFTDCGTPLS